MQVQRSKEGTARVVVARELGIKYSYTMEASFAGGSKGLYSGKHYTPQLFYVRPRRVCVCVALCI